MKKYIRTTLIFAGIWFFAALLNGLISGISIALLDSDSTGDALTNLFASFAFSFLFSVPLVGFVWFITILAQVSDKKGDALLQLVLRVALFCSMAVALLFMFAFNREFTTARFIAAPGIVVSALTAILFFRKQIKANA